MRKIITSNSQIEFQEVNSTGTLLNSIGLQLGEVYFIVKGNKVSFYLNDSEKPFDSFIWSIDIPFYLDDTLIETPNDASAALRAIMNDSFQEQLDALQEELATEEGRAQAAEEALDGKIDDEIARAVSAETHLQGEITELSGTVATFDERITRNTNDISALTNTVNDEISRSVAKDAQHDAEISGLTNTLNSEIQRALSAETQLHNDIINEQNRALAAESAITANLNTEIQNRIADVDAEEARAIAAESSITANLNAEIQNRIADVDAEEARALLAESGITNNLNAEISRAQNAESVLATTIGNEVSRSTAKDAAHDAEISGLTTSLQNEINRATSAENTLRSDLNSEISRAQNAETALDAKIDAEIGDRINAISGLNNSLNTEISRATNAETALNEKVNAVSAYNASQDAQISALNNSINTEISRATSVENALRSDLNDEVSARTSADSAMLERIVAVEVGKANKSEVYTKVESDAKYATKDYVSGLTDNFYTKGQTNELLAAKADKVDAVASAEYVSSTKKINFKNIDGAIISEVDATAFIKDGMVDNVEIVNNNLVITFNTDSGKEPISIPLTDIFNPNNYYTKTEINNIENAQNSKINEISGKTDDVITEVQTISGDVQTLNEKVETISGESVTSGEVQTMIDNSISGKQDTLSAGRAIDITNNVVSFTLPISAGTGDNSVVEGANTKAYSNNCHAEGRGSSAGVNGSNNGYSSHAEGEVTIASGNMSHSEGNHTQATGGASHAEGNYTYAIGESSHAEGSDTVSYNDYEHASGKFNNSKKLNTTYGNSGNTIFSVGNGKGDTKRHNTIEVRQNGDIYIADTSQITGTGSGETEGHNFYDVPMIKLQDALSGGGGGVTPSEVQTMIDESISGKTNQSDFTAHTSNTNVHVTASEKSTWNAKPNVWCGDETAWSQISGSTESGTIYLVY